MRLRIPDARNEKQLYALLSSLRGKIMELSRDPSLGRLRTAAGCVAGYMTPGQLLKSKRYPRSPKISKISNILPRTTTPNRFKIADLLKCFLQRRFFAEFPGHIH